MSWTEADTDATGNAYRLVQMSAAEYHSSKTDESGSMHGKCLAEDDGYVPCCFNQRRLASAAGQCWLVVLASHSNELLPPTAT